MLRFSTFMVVYLIKKVDEIGHIFKQKITFFSYLL